MKVFKNSTIPKKYKRSAIAIGNFDGIHKGHQKIFKQAKTIVKKNKIKSKIIECKTIREKNGIACSSRNFLLSAKENFIASQIYKIIVKQKKKCYQKKNITE